MMSERQIPMIKQFAHLTRLAKSKALLVSSIEPTSVPLISRFLRAKRDGSAPIVTVFNAAMILSVIQSAI